MKLTLIAKPIAIASLVALSAGMLSACGERAPAQNVGQKIDQTASQAGKKLGEVIERVDAKIDQQAAKTADVLDDAEITTRVKAAIFAEPGLKTLQISVDTNKGVVTLTGSVDTPADRELGSSLAGAVAGVKQVINELVIKPAKTTGQQ